MSSISGLTGVFNHFFEPPLEVQTTTNKDAIDHLASHADSAEGAWDIFRILDHGLAYAAMLPSLTVDFLSSLGKVREIVRNAGIGLSIPKIIVDGNAMRQGIRSLFQMQDLPYSDPLRTRKIAQAFKKTFLDAVNFTNTTSQVALFLENAKVCVFEGIHLRMIEGVNNLTSIVSDCGELVKEYFKLKQYHSPEAQPCHPEECVKLEQKKRLSWMIIAKDIASIAGAAIGLVGIVFGIALQSAPMITGTVLVLSTVWLTMKLASYFYDKIVVEESGEAHNQLITLHV